MTSRALPRVFIRKNLETNNDFMKLLHGQQNQETRPYWFRDCNEAKMMNFHRTIPINGTRAYCGHKHFGKNRLRL